MLALAALLPLPVGQVEVVVDGGGAEARVPQRHVEEGLGRQQRVPEVLAQPRDGLVPPVHHVLGKLGVEGDPVGAAVHLGDIHK